VGEYTILNREGLIYPVGSCLLEEGDVLVVIREEGSVYRVSHLGKLEEVVATLRALPCE
jgi:K+/H+ antiporter YhaU regulatory subunit KhtT